MTFGVSCYWADSCADCSCEIEANSIKELFSNLEEFFEEACGMSGVESFYIRHPSKEYEFEWSNEWLRRNQDLEDDWNKTKKEIQEWLGKDFFDENPK